MRARRATALRVRARSEHGAAAVEFALVLPILAMLMMGIVTAGLGYSQALGMTNAVREGARFGATTAPASAIPYTTAQWTTWANTVNDRTRAMMADSHQSEVTVCASIWKNSSTTVAAVPSLVVEVCDEGSQGVDGDSGPTPPVVPPGTCAVTAWGVKEVNVNALLVRVNPEVRRGSVAGYERAC